MSGHYPPHVRKAMKTRVTGCADCGVVNIELVDERGEVFAVAPFDPAVAEQLARDLVRVVAECRRAGTENPQHRGHGHA